MLRFLRLLPAFRALESELVSLRDRLSLAVEAQESASEQVVVERALRESAEQRADRYHDELTEALKLNADWMAWRLSNRSMFGVGQVREEAKTEKVTEIPTKRMARDVANSATHDTLRDLLNDIRAGRSEETQVGPEFTTQ